MNGLNGVKFTYSSTLECPDCNKVVQVGTTGYKNLEAHHASKACCQACSKRKKGDRLKKPLKPNQVLDVFFKPHTPLNPSTVSAPPPILPTEALTIHPEYCMLDRTETNFHAKPSAKPTGQVTESSLKPLVWPLAQLGACDFPTENQTQGAMSCQRGVKLLQDLEAAVNQILSDTPSTNPDHRLSIFVVDPHTCVAEPGEDDWAILNQMMKSAFGWGKVEMAVAIPQMLNCGEHVLDGFIHFMTFFVRERGLKGALFETKVESLIKELEDR
jgi:hypothetical protein